MDVHLYLIPGFSDRVECLDPWNVLCRFDWTFDISQDFSFPWVERKNLVVIDSLGITIEIFYSSLMP